MTLNEKQQAAVDSRAAQVLVVAAPGSGKTRVLAAAAASNPPHETIILTFTNTAAREIQSRMPESWKPSYCGTLHGYLLRLIMRGAPVIGFPEKITVMTADQAELFIDQVCRDHGFKGTKKALREALGGSTKDRTAASVATEYWRRQREMGVLDFDSIIRWGTILLRNHGMRVMETLLLVDEYQDSSAEDDLIYDLLPVSHKFFVGDEDQAIYGWRRQSAPVMVRRATKAAVFFLDINYRSIPEICAAADRLIGHNFNRFEKKMKSGLDEGTAGEFLMLTNLPNENLEVVDRLTSWLAAGMTCAVLVRTNVLVAYFRDLLDKMKVPVVKTVQNEAPYDWKEATNCLSLLANPDNDYLAIQFLERLWSNPERVATAKREAAAAFATINDVALKIPFDLDLGQVTLILCKFGFSQASITAIRVVMDSSPECKTVADLALAASRHEFRSTKEPEFQGKVEVLTVHGAKGREFDGVIMAAMEDGIMGSSVQDEQETQEIRRLVYVGMTRARTHLVISSAATRADPYKGIVRDMTPCRFFAEIDVATEIC